VCHPERCTRKTSCHPVVIPRSYALSFSLSRKRRESYAAQSNRRLMFLRALAHVSGSRHSTLNGYSMWRGRGPLVEVFKSFPGRLVVALLLSAAALLLRWFLDPVLGNNQPYAASAAAIAAAVWFCGWIPASVTALVLTIAANYLFFDSRGSLGLDPQHFTGSIGFLFSGAVIIFLGEQARRANDYLRQRDREKDVFLATLSHELRNPIAAIRNTNTILKNTSTQSELAHHAIELQDRQVRHLTRLIDDLLDVNRFTHGRLRIHCKLIDVRQCIDDAINGTSGLLSVGAKKLVTDVPEDAIPVLGDPSRILQIIVNLIGNAAKYSPDASQIYLRATAENGCAVISVTDEGIGIEEHLMPHIFDLFYIGREHLSGKHGLGVGLWLARKLAEVHGGKITAKSEGPGKGSEFTVRLPLAERHVDVRSAIEAGYGTELTTTATSR
jgi:signal transduction histidine kinase